MTKVGLAAVGTLVLYVIAVQLNMLPGRFVQKSVVPEEFSLPTDAPASKAETTDAVPLPATAPAAARGPQIRLNTIPWNATFGLAFANGGPMTTTGSLMEKHGIRLMIARQNDQNVTQAEQVKFANALASDANPASGVHYAIIMGDGAAQYVAGINTGVAKLGSEYFAEVVGIVGFSGNSISGEDAFMGPEDWKLDPSTMKGGLVAGVLRDGDWNLALYYLLQNKVKNNPDERTWDPDALNWAATDDFVKAGELFTSGYCEDREVVRDGKKTGEKKHACVQGVVTWTPGDVTVAHQKGGIVKILSTKENANQMPSTVVGIRKWGKANPKKVEEMLAAAFDGSNQIRTYDAALKRASFAQFAILKEESATYWLKYYKGVIESDRKGLPIPLGGSRTANLGDNLMFFGLAEGSGGSLKSSLFNATYDGFGKIVKQQYPRLVADYPPVEEVVNTQYIEALAKRMSTTPSETASFSEGAIEKENVVAKRDWSITFDTGKASFTPAARATLDELFQAVSIGSLSIEIDGHTDNVGNAVANKALSEARAFAVKNWLTAKAPALFPAARINVKAFGDTMPVDSNASETGRAKNRRVTIILGTK
jgi:outer membrane protein OmpA-like peptidoglycan-associated protein